MMVKPIYHLIEISTGRLNDIGAQHASDYNDRMSNTYYVDGVEYTRENPLYQVVAGTCPKTTPWTHRPSLRARLKGMLVKRAPDLDNLADDLYLQLNTWVDQAIDASNPRTLRAIAGKFRQAKPAALTLSNWLEQGAIECERDADAMEAGTL